ncbi:MAG: mechanosensitive ion channel family protein [Bacteroides sp.]|nr:mechanosensitive ion channel family protein [Bacteroides sp.]MCM1413203.1 mechanosensitive ion channel family protein [Bacteroides sp.]MCM1472055.1 mechanosensitive ion channel family protein [Bacteroides sp.]
MSAYFLPLEIIPSHEVATWLLVNIRRLLDHIGLEHDRRIEEVVYVAAIVAFALFLGWLARIFILWAVRKFVKLRKTNTAEKMLKEHIFEHCSHIIPPLVILGLLPFTFDTKSLLLNIFRTGLLVYLIITITIAINKIIKFIWERYNARENTKNLPLAGILNVCTGIVWIISIIVIGSVLMDKSPMALLTGLGAFATVLMLIFKDSILGFVAGIQLSQNDMVRIGDWIVVPSTIANGIVIDMSLTAVKVQNWDNTIVTLPPYTLVSTSFQNWRGMSDSGYRLISRSVYFDVDSVVNATPEMIAGVSDLPNMKPFVEKIQASGQFYDPGLATVNGTLQTNMGLFRGYMCEYLLHHPLIGTDQQILVRIMSPDASGYPLQIYCYTTTAWTAYEAIQSEIFEHIAAVAPKFGLRLFNNPSGRDVKSLAEANPKPEASATASA